MRGVVTLPDSATPLPPIHLLIAGLPLFSELGMDDVARIAAGCREKSLVKGELLFQKGDPARGIYVVLSGQIKLAFPSTRGTEKVVDIVGPRQSFGEASNEYQQCVRNRATGSSRTSGGSFGGFSSGGSHK